jgi:Glyoxalase-like domain
MPARISCVCIDAVRPRPVADFWAAVLRWDVVEEDDEGISLASPARELPTLDILAVPDAKQTKNRLHFDLRADGTSFDAEVDRLEALGAPAGRRRPGPGCDVGGLRRPRRQRILPSSPYRARGDGGAGLMEAVGVPVAIATCQTPTPSTTRFHLLPVSHQRR